MGCHDRGATSGVSCQYHGSGQQETGLPIPALTERVDSSEQRLDGGSIRLEPDLITWEPGCKAGELSLG